MHTHVLKLVYISIDIEFSEVGSPDRFSAIRAYVLSMFY